MIMYNDQFEIHRLPKRIIKNTLYNTAGNWIVLGLNFLIIPYVIGKLGVELYGSAWVVGILIIASAPFIDFGLGSASIKFIAEYNANQQYDKINEIVSTGVFYYAIFGVILLLIVSLFGVKLLALIGVPPNFSDEAFFVLFFSTFILILINTCSPLTSVVTSLQRMDLTNTVTVTTALLNIFQTLIVLSTNLGIRGLIVGYLVINIISISWLIFLSYRLLPQLKLKLLFVNRDALKQLWHFGINLQLSRISQIVVFQLDKIFALRFFGSASAAFYEVAVKVATLARNIPLVLTSALLPVASEMDAKKEDQKVNILFERGSRYLIIVGMLLLGYIFIMSRLIIQTWMGKTLSQEGIDAASNVMKILVIGYFFNMTTGIASTIAAGINRTDIERNV
ncbi:MAG: oligosaccharide flippase family protein, partial [Ignavibacteriales bacterium]|nr:oligosaccharide flippase family protein [Ignavibacteriales bacterium]